MSYSIKFFNEKWCLMFISLITFSFTPPQAIGARNLLKSMAKQRESQQQQLVGLIHEKKTQLERHRLQLQSLEKTETEQKDFIDQFILQK